MEQPSAAETLDRIRAGGGHLLLTAQARITEVKALLDRGEFRAAMEASGRLAGLLKRLGDAEAMIGRLAESHLIVCSQIEPGMVLLDLGTVKEVGTCDCGQPNCPHLALVFEDDETLVVPREAEIAVANDESAA